MAAPSYTTDLQTFVNGSSLTGFVEFTGYTSGTKQVIDTDLAIYGASCISASNRASSPCSLAFDVNEPAGWSSGDNFFVWQKFFAPNALATFANGGIIIGIGNTSANFYEYKIEGSDTYAYGGWKNYAVNPLITTNRTTVGSPSGVWDVVGVGWDMINGIAKGNALTVDIIRWGRGESRFTGGETADYATIDGFATVNDNPTTGRFGLLQAIQGGYLFKGFMSLGLTGTAVDFRDENVSITIEDSLNVNSTFNKIEVHNASSNVEMTGFNITSLCTASPCSFEMIDNATVSLLGCTFTDMGTFTFLSNGDMEDSVFRRCDQVTPQGASLVGVIVDSYEGTAGTAAVVYNTNADPDGEFDGMTFIKGTAATHAIEFGSSVPSSMTLRDCDFTGYNSADDANDSTFYFSDTNSGNTYTLNLNGCTGNVSVDTAGCVVNIVQDPVTILITAKDIETDLAVVGARAYLYVASGANYPYQASVSITSSGTTATVTHTAHGLETGEKVLIRGVDQREYNKIATITVTNANTYTYTIVATTSPATGTPTATYVIIDGVTNGSGQISDTRSWSAAQPIAGRLADHSGSPYYKRSPISGETVSTTIGLTLNKQLLRDE